MKKSHASMAVGMIFLIAALGWQFVANEQMPPFGAAAMIATYFIGVAVGIASERRELMFTKTTTEGSANDV